MKISEKIELVEQLWAKDVEILKGLNFNQKQNIERIYFYKNDKFVECGDDTAIFWNVTKPYIMHFAKNIDLDTKDFRTIGLGDTNVYQA